MSRATTSPFATLLWLVSGFILWSLAFVALYGLHGAACATDWAAVSPDGVRAALWTAGAAHLAAGSALVAWTWRRRRRRTETAGPGRRFVDQAALTLAAVGLASTAWLAMPTLFLSIC